MFKVGLIGCGFMGSMHADCYAALGDRVSVVAVADLEQEKAKKTALRFGARLYRDAEDLIENAEVDFVDICLPTYLHCRFAVMAMLKGRDVFLEKPLCLKEEECSLLLSVQKETGRRVQVGQVIRFWDEYVWLKEAKESGRYGKLLFITLRRHSPRPAWAWQNWLHQPSLSGGMALDMHIHDVDFLRSLLGEPLAVKSLSKEEAPGLSDYIASLYDYGDAMAMIDCSWNYPEGFPFSMYFCARFEKATVVYDSGAGSFMLYELGREGAPILKEEAFCAKSSSGGNVSDLGGYYNELKYFLDRLENPALPDIASLEEGASSVKLALRELAEGK